SIRNSVIATQRGAAWPISTARPPVISIAEPISVATAVMKMASSRLCAASAGSVQADKAGGVSAAPTRMASAAVATGGMVTGQARRPYAVAVSTVTPDSDATTARMEGRVGRGKNFSAEEGGWPATSTRIVGRTLSFITGSMYQREPSASGPAGAS